MVQDHVINHQVVEKLHWGVVQLQVAEVDLQGVEIQE
jgi:hypothetical protein